MSPIAEIDHRVIGDGRIGPISQRIQQLYFDVVKGKVPKYRHWCHTGPRRRPLTVAFSADKRNGICEEVEVRRVKFLEYQAKEVFAAAGIPTPKGRVAKTPDEARAIADELGGAVVVKAQVPIGGRGKAGGVAVVKNADEAPNKRPQRILSMDIRGYPVEEVLIEGAADIKAEFYLGVTVDRARQAPVLDRLLGRRHGHRRGRRDPSRQGGEGLDRSRDRAAPLPGAGGMLSGTSAG